MTNAILWRRLDLPGHDFATLAPRDGAWRLSGTAVFLHEADPCKLDYLIDCDAGWRTTGARVSGAIGRRVVTVSISVDAERRWFVNGVESTEVAGCVDIDFAFSPATNMLPIRRLALRVGEESAVTAAWLAFPSMTLEPLEQTYRRERERTYRYISDGGQFARVLDVDEVGFVKRYPGLWEAESA